MAIYTYMAIQFLIILIHSKFTGRKQFSKYNGNIIIPSGIYIYIYIYTCNMYIYFNLLSRKLQFFDCVI